MSKYILDLVSFCNEIDKFNNKKEKIIHQPQLNDILRKIKTNLTLTFPEQVNLLWNINIDSTKQSPYSPPNIIDYRAMTFYQVSYYLYWRTQIRNNNMLYTDFIYIKIYVYELILQSKDPNVTIEKILSFYKTYPYNKENFKSFLQTILKDFFLINNFKLQYTYKDLLNLFCLYQPIKTEDENFAKRIFNQNISFYNKKSTYKIENSKFYQTPVGKKILDEIFPYIFTEIDKYFTMYRQDLVKTVYGDFVVFPHTIFRDLTNFNPNIPSSIITLNDFEIYFYDEKKNTWSFKKRRNYNITSSFFAYVLKYTEKRLREYSKYKNKITVSKDAMIRDLSTEIGVSIIIRDNNFDKCIDNAIQNYIVNLKKDKKLSFNTENIDSIKQITIENEQKLKVEEYEENLNIEKSIQTNQIPSITKNKTFSNTLSNLEKSVIYILINNENPTTLIKENNTMPEIIYEQINEKALDYFGDYIIDTIDVPYIYEDYLSELEDI